MPPILLEKFKPLKMLSQPDSNLPTEIILVYGSLRTGGIETLIVRTANFFSQTNISVSVFCTERGALASSLEARVKIFYYKEMSDLALTTRLQVQSTANSKFLVMSFDPISAARALRVEREISKKNLKVTHLSGVFHPRAYFMDGERKDRVFLNRMVARAIGKKRLFFMNEECKSAHSAQWKTCLSNNSILMLPINQINAKWKPKDSPEVRIVSVGRLVDFKSYNLGAARIVKTCMNHGIAVTWDIYGDGPLRRSIESEIKYFDVSSQVRLMGDLDYATFSLKVASYDLFIGMGTAALEAAMVGVPTVCATVDEATHCYGYLHNLPFGNVGERQSKTPMVDLTDLIKDYSSTTQAERTLLSQQSRSVALEYGMPRFAEALARMTNTSTPAPPMLFKMIIAALYSYATESWLAKVARHHQLKKDGVT